MDPRGNAVFDMQIATDHEGNPVPAGFFMPSVTLEQRNAITFVDEDQVNGLFVYNLDENCPNYYKKGSGWVSLCSEEESVLIYIEESAKIIGAYKKLSPVSSVTNFLTLGAEVITPGPYNVTAKAYHYTVAGDPNPTENDYYFSGTGTLAMAGSTILSIPGGGTPRNYTTEEDSDPINFPNYPYPMDSVVIYMNGKYFATIANRVENNEIPVLFNITSANFVGTMQAGQKTAGYIRVTLSNVTVGMPYELFTNNVNGISFYASGTVLSTTDGTFSVDVKPVIGQDVVEKAGSFTWSLSSNSAGDGITQVDVPVTALARRIKVRAVGTDATYCLTNSFALNYFKSPSSPIQIVDFDFKSTTSSSNFVSYANDADIFIVSYNAGYTNASGQQAAIQALLNRGGTFIYVAETNMTRVMTDFFGGTPGTTVTGYTINGSAVSNPTPGSQAYKVIYGGSLNDPFTTIIIDAGGNAVYNSNVPAAAESVTVVNGNPRTVVHNSQQIFVHLDGGAFRNSFTNSTTGNNYKVLRNVYAWAIEHLIEFEAQQP